MPIKKARVPSAPSAKRPTTARPTTARNMLRKETHQALGRYLGDEKLEEASHKLANGEGGQFRKIGADVASERSRLRTPSPEMISMPIEFRFETEEDLKERKKLDEIKKGATDMAFNCLKTLATPEQTDIPSETLEVANKRFLNHIRPLFGAFADGCKWSKLHRRHKEVVIIRYKKMIKRQSWRRWMKAATGPLAKRHWKAFLRSSASHLTADVIRTWRRMAAIWKRRREAGEKIRKAALMQQLADPVTVTWMVVICWAQHAAKRAAERRIACMQNAIIAWIKRTRFTRRFVNPAQSIRRTSQLTSLLRQHLTEKRQRQSEMIEEELGMEHGAIAGANDDDKNEADGGGSEEGKGKMRRRTDSVYALPDAKSLLSEGWGLAPLSSTHERDREGEGGGESSGEASTATTTEFEGGASASRVKNTTADDEGREEAGGENGRENSGGMSERNSTGRELSAQRLEGLAHTKRYQKARPTGIQIPVAGDNGHASSSVHGSSASARRPQTAAPRMAGSATVRGEWPGGQRTSGAGLRGAKVEAGGGKRRGSGVAVGATTLQKQGSAAGLQRAGSKLASEGKVFHAAAVPKTLATPRIEQTAEGEGSSRSVSPLTTRMHRQSSARGVWTSPDALPESVKGLTAAAREGLTHPRNGLTTQTANGQNRVAPSQSGAAVSPLSQTFPPSRSSATGIKLFQPHPAHAPAPPFGQSVGDKPGVSRSESRRIIGGGAPLSPHPPNMSPDETAQRWARARAIVAGVRQSQSPRRSSSPRRAF